MDKNYRIAMENVRNTRSNDEKRKCKIHKSLLTVALRGEGKKQRRDSRDYEISS